MIKNTFIKNAIKNSIFPVLTFINKLIPKDDKIVLLYTANKGTCFALLPLRKYLLDNGYDKKYDIYCGIEHIRYAENIPGITFIDSMHSILKFFKAGHVFYTAGQIPIKPAREQKVFHMRHGNANFKSSGNNTTIGNGDEFFFTKMIAPSDYFVPVMAKEYGCSEDNIAVAGDPMCDQLLQYQKNSYDLSKYDKVLMWMPTFRQSDYYGINDTTMEEIVPMFPESSYEELNARLAKYNILLLVKIHGQQKTYHVKCRHFSHLRIYTNAEFEADGYETYHMMAQSDGLIGDYSSASLQYLMLDRPQAYVVPDLEEYGKNRTFVFQNVEEYMGGHIIKTQEDFWKFLDDFANNHDMYKEKRNRIYDVIYKYHDDKSCERIIKLSDMSI